MPQALSGLRVLDVTQVMAGPFCAMLLCDMGADVIKLEPPTGDDTRHWGDGKGTDTPAFNAVNRGKRSVVVDLKTSEGVAVARRLAQRADILIENYRPGVMASLGLDYPSLHAANPRLRLRVHIWIRTVGVRRCTRVALTLSPRACRASCR